MSQNDYPKELVDTAVTMNCHAHVYNCLKYMNELMVQFAAGFELALEAEVPLPVELVKESIETFFVGLNHAKEFNKLAMQRSQDYMNEYKAEHGLEKVDIEAPEFTELKEMVLSDPRMDKLRELLSENVAEAKERLTKEQAEKGLEAFQEFLKTQGMNSNGGSSAN
jgi:hypothetical protein